MFILFNILLILPNRPVQMFSNNHKSFSLFNISNINSVILKLIVENYESVTSEMQNNLTYTEFVMNIFEFVRLNFNQNFPISRVPSLNNVQDNINMSRMLWVLTTSDDAHPLETPHSSNQYTPSCIYFNFKLDLNQYSKKLPKCH